MTRTTCLQIHPNPASDLLALNYENTDNVVATLELYNTVGKLHDKQTLNYGGTYSIDVSQVGKREFITTALLQNGKETCGQVTN